MKKIYSAPSVTVTTLVAKEHVLDGSIKIDGNVTTSGTKGGWVKENNYSGREGNHSVWDDDWSQ